MKHIKKTCNTTLSLYLFCDSAINNLQSLHPKNLSDSQLSTLVCLQNLADDHCYHGYCLAVTTTKMIEKGLVFQMILNVSHLVPCENKISISKWIDIEIHKLKHSLDIKGYRHLHLGSELIHKSFRWILFLHESFSNVFLNASYSPPSDIQWYTLNSNHVHCISIFCAALKWLLSLEVQFWWCFQQSIALQTNQ